MLSRLASVSKDAAVYGVAGALSRFSGLVLLPLFTNFFSSEEYGLYQSVTNLGALLLSISVLGLDGATALLYFARDDAAYRKTVTTLWVLMSVAVSVPLTLALFAGAEWISLLATGTAEHAPLFRLGVAVLPFSIFLFTANNILRYMFKARTYAALNFGLTLAVAGSIILLVAVARMGLEGALWGTLIGTALLTLPGAWSIRSALSAREPFGSSEVRATAARMLQLGLPLVPASVALWVTNFSNTYFLLQLVGEGAAGVFRIGAQLAALLSLIIWAFQLAWGPYSLSIAQAEDAPRTYSRVATLYTAGTVGASVVLSALAPALLQILTTRAYAEAASVIGLLSLSAAAAGAYQVVAIGVNLAQRTGAVAWTAMLAAATNVVLNIALIPMWSMVGAGLASLAANLASTVAVYWMSQRLHPIPYRPLRITAIWLTGGACVAASGLFNVVVDPDVWAALGMALLLLAVYAGVMVGLRIVTAGEIAAVREAVKRSRRRG